MDQLGGLLLSPKPYFCSTVVVLFAEACRLARKGRAHSAQSLLLALGLVGLVAVWGTLFFWMHSECLQTGETYVQWFIESDAFVRGFGMICETASAWFWSSQTVTFAVAWTFFVADTTRRGPAREAYAFSLLGILGAIGGASALHLAHIGCDPTPWRGHAPPSEKTGLVWVLAVLCVVAAVSMRLAMEPPFAELNAFPAALGLIYGSLFAVPWAVRRLHGRVPRGVVAMIGGASLTVQAATIYDVVAQSQGAPLSESLTSLSNAMFSNAPVATMVWDWIFGAGPVLACLILSNKTSAATKAAALLSPIVTPGAALAVAML